MRLVLKSGAELSGDYTGSQYNETVMTLVDGSTSSREYVALDKVNELKGEPVSSSVDSSAGMEGVFEHLATGGYVRVLLTNGGEVAGTLARLENGTVTVVERGDTKSVSIGDTEAVEVPMPSP